MMMYLSKLRATPPRLPTCGVTIPSLLYFRLSVSARGRAPLARAGFQSPRASQVTSLLMTARKARPSSCARGGLGRAEVR